MVPTNKAFRSLSWVLIASALVARSDAQLPIRSERFGGTPNGHLGAAVAATGDVDGDGRPDFVVGEPVDPWGPGAPSGNVWVVSGATGLPLYTRTGNGPDWYGFAVAPAGDVDADGRGDFLVGAHLDATLVPNGGRVDLISGAAGTLIRSWYGPTPGGVFGGFLAGLGDVDGDGVPDVAVSSTGENSAGTQSGAVRIFSGATGALLVAYFGAVAHAQLVRAAGLGDLNGDGKAEYALGYGGPPGTPGHVDVRSGATGALLYTVAGPTPNGYFGRAIDAGGDANGDGVGDFVVGAPFAGTSASVTGMASLHSGADGSVLHTVTGTYDLGLTGTSVAMAGDVDGDGAADFVVGSPGAAPYGNTFAGEVRFYSGATGALLAAFSGDSQSDQFGRGLAGVGDVDGDGFSDVVVGAPNDGGGGLNAGLYRVYSPVGARRYGTGSGLGVPPQLAWVGAGGVDPAVGAVVLGGAQPAASALLGISTGWWFEPTPLFTLLVDPSPANLLLVPFQCDAAGAAVFPATLRVPALSGLSLFIQAAVEPLGGGGFSASNGLEVRFTL